MAVVPLSDSYVHREKLFNFYDSRCIRVALTTKSRDFFLHEDASDEEAGIPCSRFVGLNKGQKLGFKVNHLSVPMKQAACQHPGKQYLQGMEGKIQKAMGFTILRPACPQERTRG